MDFIAWEIPTELQSDREVHSTRQILYQAYNIWPILKNLQCTYRPWSSGFIEQTNKEVKIPLGEIYWIFKRAVA